MKNRCPDCECCVVGLCATALVNRKSCVDYALVWTAALEERVAACPCAPRGVRYVTPSNVVSFPSRDVSE